MTEDDARSRWCPMVRNAGGIDWTGSANRDPQSGSTGADAPYYKCIASDCMMWRWKISPTEAAVANAQADVGLGSDGYCGLAGKP